VTVIDSSGWIEFFTDGPQAEHYAPYVMGEGIITPTIVLYEVYKIIRREATEEQALMAAAHLQAKTVVALDETLALEAAEASLEHGLAMADAIVFATARRYDAELATGDADLGELPGVTFLPKAAPG
jgi:predicted nucleic acid-binding protein